MPNNHLEKNLWDAADELRANSKLRAADYSIPVLGLIFLKYADHKFAHATKQFQAQGWSLNLGRYVGVPEREEDDDFDFAIALTELHEELETLNAEAHELEARIGENVAQLLGNL